MQNSTAYCFVAATIFSSVLLFSCNNTENKRQSIADHPNVILIMTDDQGIGDFGFMGNPYIKTPHLDNLASQSLNLSNFHVSPSCTTTRASLMTGRYSQRTGVYKTNNGGAVMSSDELTMAEVLKESGYKTGIFGKWHSMAIISEVEGRMELAPIMPRRRNNQRS